ncbi:MAG: glycosyltransferase [Melioribacteraceae bacterium]
MNEKPLVSVIICTYNREKYLPSALHSLKNQTVDKKKYEIIIVNNNSTDNTEEISKRFIKENPELNIKYVVETQKGLSAARNRGIKESDGEIIIFIDDDAEVTPNYVEEAIKFFQTYDDVDAMGGKIIPKYEDGKEPEWMSIFLWGLVTKSDWGNKIRKYPYSKSPYGCSMALRKNALYDVGMFNEQLIFRSEDKYIFFQLKRHKKKYLYNPNFIVFHNVSKERITDEAFKRISLSVGAGEFDRIKNEGFLIKILKLIEYTLKLLISVLISIYYTIKNKPLKGGYLILNRWLTLLGYVKRIADDTSKVK